MTVNFEGMAPLFVCCTAGTTVYGAWDPIDKIADICERHRIWLHVDVWLKIYQELKTKLGLL